MDEESCPVFWRPPWQCRQYRFLSLPMEPPVWFGTLTGVSGKRSQDGALEEVGGLELKGAYLDTDSERGNVLTVTGGWNNQNSGHANIPNGADLFGKKSIYPAGGYQDDRHRG